MEPDGDSNIAAAGTVAKTPGVSAFAIDARVPVTQRKITTRKSTGYLTWLFTENSFILILILILMK
jgi:hypothetical protein